MSADVPPFELVVESANGCLHFTPRGELDLATAPELEDRIVAAVRDVSRGVVLDLRELTFMDSTGVRTVVSAHHAAQETGADLRVIRPRDGGPVARVIEVSGIDQALGLVDAP